MSESVILQELKRFEQQINERIDRLQELFDRISYNLGIVDSEDDEETDEDEYEGDEDEKTSK
jgi:hypothetical protein